MMTTLAPILAMNMLTKVSLIILVIVVILIIILKIKQK
jgi:hypothetical protein